MSYGINNGGEGMAIEPQASENGNAMLDSILARLNALEEENKWLKVINEEIKEMKEIKEIKWPKSKLSDPKKFLGNDLTFFS